METIEKTIEVEAPVSKVYNQWTLTGPVAWAIALPTHQGHWICGCKLLCLNEKKFLLDTETVFCSDWLG